MCGWLLSLQSPEPIACPHPTPIKIWNLLPTSHCDVEPWAGQEFARPAR